MVTCRWEPPRALESLPDPTPSPSSGFPSAVDIQYTKEKKAQKVRTTPRRPPRARGGPQQQHLLAEKRATSDIPIQGSGAKSEHTPMEALQGRSHSPARVMGQLLRNTSSRRQCSATGQQPRVGTDGNIQLDK